MSGDTGEQEVVDLVRCPNCGKSLMILPTSYPLFDVQCVGYSFRAQVKTNHSNPKSTILGAGWEIMDKVLKSGYMVLPMFANFKWQENGKDRQEIRFYPFIPKKNLKHYKLSEKAVRANYHMFRYENLDTIPYFTPYEIS